jgi:hypothetical protein
MAHNVRVAAENLAEHHQHNLLIAHKADHNVRVLVENQVAEDLLPVDQVHVLALVAHLERMLARKRITRVRKLAVKRSTICKRRLWVALLFLAVMEVLQFDFAVVHLLLTSPRKLAQIPQR